MGRVIYFPNLVDMNVIRAYDIKVQRLHLHILTDQDSIHDT